MKQKICIIGLGYIGLPTAAMFAKYGCQVIGVDTNPKVVEALRAGRIIIEEPFLQELVSEVVASGSLEVAVEPTEADVFIITVPTPILDNKNSDMSYVVAASESIVGVLKSGNVVILESTSRVGATEEIVRPILERSGLKVPEDIRLGYCPERVLPGKILEELVGNSRIIGGMDESSAVEIRDIYKHFVKGEMHLTNTKTAEMCKIMENTFRDVNIALSNELAQICEVVGIDVWEVITLCNKHPRVDFLAPGPGVGGHCLAVDPWFIVEMFPEMARMIRTARETNDSMPEYLFKKIEKLLPRQYEGSYKVTILGMTYKPDIDDMRESPIVELIHLLKGSGYEVAVVDPFVKQQDYPTQGLYEACQGSDLILLGVHHSLFYHLPYQFMATWMRGNKVLDTRNMIDPKEVERAGLTYYRLGSGSI